ncbi:histone-fold-containing protein [Xylaria digitata]|nr:histone-fold-containing protein [Xylaria digitata]
MPPRKIDPTKRGDVSMAQFVYDGDTDQTGRASAVPPQLKHTTSASSSTPATQMETDDPAESSLLVEKEKEKDKDKEREKKDKEKEKDSSKDAVTIEDLTLPKSIITRLAKGVLPSNTQIQANAILAMSKSATIFINHLANAANEHTLNNNKKTIMPGDVFTALDDIEFPFFRERLEAEFKKFNDTQTSKRNTYRRKVAAQKKAEKSGPDAADPNTSLISNASTATDSNSAPRSKKQKPNAAHEESAMDVDDDETQEPHDASDADTEPEQEPDEDDEDEEDQENAEEDEEEEDEEDDDEENEDEMRDRLEERRNHEDDDDALDNDGDSD